MSIETGMKNYVKVPLLPLIGREWIPTPRKKRKVCDEREKVCRIDPQEDEEIAKLESKISKVSTMCGKMLTSVQQLDIDDPLRVILADLIETVRITNEVQEEIHSKQRKSREQAVAVEKECEIFSMWDRSDFPPPPVKQQKTVRNDNRKKPAGGLVSMSIDGRGRNPQIHVQNPQKRRRRESTVSSMKQLRTPSGLLCASTWTWAILRL